MAATVKEEISMKLRQFVAIAAMLSLSVPALAWAQGGQQQKSQEQKSQQQGLDQAEMRQVEEHLKAAGFNPGPVDGTFTTETGSALREYQKKHNLPVTGLIDEATQQKLMTAQQQNGQQQQGKQQADQDQVRQSQQRLKDLGFYEGSIDGIYGPETEAALREYQARQGLQVTGALTKETHQALMQSKQRGPQQAEKAMEQNLIRQAQERLKEDGFYTGAIDGAYGPETEEALREYQKAKGLQVTGSLNQETRQTLLQSSQQQKGQQSKGKQQ
jgi:peptidoglycan hydrolase-like protein with peptidoglycan-binding domain